MEYNTTQSTEIPQSVLHIKAVYNNEFRRFAMESHSYADMEATIRSLFTISPTSVLKLLFLDDEKDWVFLSTDKELAYASEIGGSPLRISVKVPSDSVLAEESKQPEVATFVSDFFERKITHINERLAKIEAKLASGQLSNDQARALRWKQAHMQKKLEHIKWKQAHTEQQWQQRKCRGRGGRKCHPHPPVEAGEEGEHFRFPMRGGRGCRQRGRFAVRHGAEAMENESTETPNLFTQLCLCRKEMKMARRTGDAEEIQRKTEALQAVAQQWREAKRQGKAASPLIELRDRKKACVAELREAQKSGDPKRIAECKANVLTAKMEIVAAR